MYSPLLGRFISADSIVPDPANPQALNRYAYVLNNPLRYTDPSGHWVETAFDIAMLGLSIAEFVTEPSVINGLAVAVDAVSTVAPIVPAGGGLAIRALSKADDLAAVAGKVDEAAKVASDAVKPLHKNANDAVGHFGIYEIRIDNELHKIGKADMDRVTKSSQTPTRIHQQVERLRKQNPSKDVTGEVIQDLGTTTTKEAEAAERAHLQGYYNRTQSIPPGNRKSFKPVKTEKLE